MTDRRRHSQAPTGRTAEDLLTSAALPVDRAASPERCIDFGFVHLNKAGEELCGDHVEWLQDTGDTPAETIVLADGLGSGVKANILSTLTAKILATMISRQLPIEDCLQTIAETLPVDDQLGVAYSTFCALHLIDRDLLEIIRYDSPKVVMLRGGRVIPFKETCREISGKKIYMAKLELQAGDRFIAFSDGALQAGPGAALNNNWLWQDVAAYLADIADTPFTAKSLAVILLDHIRRLYGGQPGDDATVCSLLIRSRQNLNLLFGPPQSPRDDAAVVQRFVERPGLHVICGGTTAQIAARVLDRPLTWQTAENTHGIPPTSRLQGMDLVTEGYLTLQQVLVNTEDARAGHGLYFDWGFLPDGASKLTRLLLEQATDIHLDVGRAVNPLYNESGVEISFTRKMQLVNDLVASLRALGKTVTVQYV